MLWIRSTLPLRSSVRPPLIFLFCLVLVSCSQRDATESASVEPLTAESGQTEQAPAESVKTALESGRYCFSYHGDTEFRDIDLVVAADGSVSGSYAYMLSDHDAERYDEFIASISGVLSGDTFELSLLIHNNGETSEASAIWSLTDNGIMIDGAEALSCERPTSFCEADERTLFSCPLEDGTVASLCGPIGLLNAGEGYLQFRSGMPGSTPNVFPEALEGSIELFEGETTMYSGGWDTQLRFVDGDRDIRLFDRAIKMSLSEKDFASGLIIMGSDGESVEQLCRAESIQFGDMLLDPLQGIVSDGSFMWE